MSRIREPRPTDRKVERRAAVIVVGSYLVGATLSFAYPLDGREGTGLRRLDGYAAAQQETKGLRLPSGALLKTADVDLRLTAAAKWDVVGHDKNPELQAALESIVAKRDPSYAVAVIDITDPDNIAWAGVREEATQYPGSVGKVLCMAALFDGLKRAFPDVVDRERILRETMITAGSWAAGGSHTIPKFDPETGRNRFATILASDRFTLSEWLDHAVSPSANGAGAIVWREAMLLRHLGKEYPPTDEQRAAWLEETKKSDLTQLSQQVIDEPLVAAGLALEGLQQGTFWTKVSQNAIPGIASFASPLELARFLLRIEQGRLVDEWSSREMKRYLYMTRKRYRYAYAPELGDAAVFFKSGSLYQCLPEEGFQCRKYQGNGKNYMNSIVIIESPAAAGPKQRRYIVALMSNVLRKNSAWDHSRLAAAIDQAVRDRKPVKVLDDAGVAEQRRAGESE